MPFTLMCCCLWWGHSARAEMWSKDLQLRSWADSGHLSLASGICTKANAVTGESHIQKPFNWFSYHQVNFLQESISQNDLSLKDFLFKLCIFLCTNRRFHYLVLIHLCHAQWPYSLCPISFSCILCLSLSPSIQIVSPYFIYILYISREFSLLDT